MSLSDVELTAVVDELAPRVRGSVVGKVWQPTGDTLVLELGRERVVVSASPRASRLHLAAAAGSAGASAPPPGFAMLLRKRLTGFRLHELRVAAPGERVIELSFGAGRDRVIAELTGAHANVFLLDGEGAIVASLRPSGSTTRALAPGSRYALPPPAPTDARWRGRDRFGAHPGVAARVAAHYEAALAAAEEQDLRGRATAALRRELDRLSRRALALEGDLARCAEAASYRKLGDLLLAHASEVPGRGAASATVPDDFEDGAPLTIALDPALDARQNAARYYRQHKRLSAGRAHAEARLAETRARIAAVEEDVSAIETASLEELRRRTPAPAARARRRAAPAPRLPYREYVSAAGDPILVGRSSSDNDTLTFRIARGNDLWLHTRDAAGSHVVVPRRGAAEAVPEATLLDAATLAAHFSPLRGESQVDVMYTRVKSLRKPRGAASGLVYASETRTIRVRLEPERLARLLDGEDEARSRT